MHIDKCHCKFARQWQTRWQSKCYLSLLDLIRAADKGSHGKNTALPCFIFDNNNYNNNQLKIKSVTWIYIKAVMFSNVLSWSDQNRRVGMLVKGICAGRWFRLPAINSAVTTKKNQHGLRSREGRLRRANELDTFGWAEKYVNSLTPSSGH